MTENLDPASDLSSDQASQKHAGSFGYGWIGHLLSVLDSNLQPEAKATILRECTSFHYNDAQMGAIVSQYRDELEGFIEFLTEQWQWQITFYSQRDWLSSIQMTTFHLLHSTLC